MWYANFLFALVSLAWIIFWYERLKDGLSCSKKKSWKVIFLKCLSLNNPRGWKPFPQAIVNDLQLPSIICSCFNMSWINVSL